MRFAFGILFSISLLALSLGCGKKDNTSSGSGASLEGTYVIIEKDFLGMKKTEAELSKEPEAERTIVIKGDQMIASKGGKEDPATFKTDTTKTPHHIDLTGKTMGKEETMYGIYKKEGDILTICIALSDKAEDRPKDFTPTKDSPTMSMTMKKK